MLSGLVEYDECKRKIDLPPAFDLRAALQRRETAAAGPKTRCHTTTPRSSHPANITCFSLRRSDLAIQGFSVMTCSAALQRSDIAVTGPQFWATPTRRLLLTAGKDLPLLPVAQRFSGANLLRTQMCFFRSCRPVQRSQTAVAFRCGAALRHREPSDGGLGRCATPDRAMHGAGEAATAAYRRGTDTRRASCRASALARRT
jgi:hypothetical protein